MSDALPHGWATTSLGALCDDRVTQGPPTAEAVQYIDISSIDRSTKRVSETTLVTGRDAPTRARQWVRSDDVLVSMTRPNLNAVAQVGPELDGAVASTGFDVLRPRAVDPRWIFYRVRTNDFVADVCEGLQGVVYPAIRPHDVRRHELPLPPLPEQHRIVSAIESYFTRLDNALAALERVQRNLKRYRASVLKAAVEGRLVPTEAELARAEGRSYEPASVLLSRILAERRRRWEEAELAKMKAKGEAPRDDKWKAKYVESVPPDTSELAELPEGWCWIRIDTAGHVQLGRQRSPAHHTGANMRPYLRVANVFEDRIDMSDVMSMNFTPKECEAYRLKFGDILLNEGQSPHLVGRPAMYRNEVPGACFTNSLVRFQAVEGVDSRFALLVFLAQLHMRRYMRIAQITTNIAHLGAGRFAEIEFPLPPLLEQSRIADEVDRLMTATHAATVTVASDLARVARLRQSILKWAFEGRLVDQDPTDEPASVLLERIRAESASATDTPPRRARRAKASAPKS